MKHKVNDTQLFENLELVDIFQLNVTMALHMRRRHLYFKTESILYTENESMDISLLDCKMGSPFLKSVEVSICLK
jgi:hypothetical protein